MKLALLLALLSTALQATAQTAFYKVLFLGNSITKHGPKADIDWTGNWGMAASAEAKDYVHLVTKSLTEKQGSAPEVMIKNIADFERAYVGYDMATKMKEAVEFKADLIILAIGENVPALKSPEDATKFQYTVSQLLQAMKADRQPTILVRSCFWADKAKDSAVQKSCAAVSGTFVNISTLGQDKSNHGRAERDFKNAGVANHPGDKGMAAIAQALVNALEK